jgi:hypothetical protein
VGGLLLVCRYTVVSVGVQVRKARARVPVTALARDFARGDVAVGTTLALGDFWCWTCLRLGTWNLLNDSKGAGFHGRRSSATAGNADEPDHGKSVYI